jgi:hypothetical protein
MMKKTGGAKYLAIIVTIIVVLAVIAGITILDPPSLQRQRKLDARRIQNLIGISYSIDAYWDRKSFTSRPTSEQEPGLKPLQDPETGLFTLRSRTASLIVYVPL